MTNLSQASKKLSNQSNVICLTAERLSRKHQRSDQLNDGQDDERAMLCERIEAIEQELFALPPTNRHDVTLHDIIDKAEIKLFKEYNARKLLDDIRSLILGGQWKRCWSNKNFECTFTGQIVSLPKGMKKILDIIATAQQGDHQTGQWCVALAKVKGIAASEAKKITAWRASKRLSQQTYAYISQSISCQLAMDAW